VAVAARDLISPMAEPLGNAPEEDDAISERIQGIEPSPQIPPYVEALVEGVPSIEAAAITDDPRLARVMCVWTRQSSVITSKPATHDHFKTGQRTVPRT